MLLILFIVGISTIMLFFPGGRKIIFSLVALAVGFGLVVALGALVLIILASVFL
jgi:hypothetical protein